jgi:hypothetical protein
MDVCKTSAADFENLCCIPCSKDNIYRTYKCKRDTDCYLSYLQSRERIPTKPFQSWMFRNHSSSVNLRVCQVHRDFLGLSWKWNRASCGYGHNVSSKAKADRGVNPSLCKQYSLKFRQTIQYKLEQVGGKLVITFCGRD